MFLFTISLVKLPCLNRYKGHLQITGKGACPNGLCYSEVPLVKVKTVTRHERVNNTVLKSHWHVSWHRAEAYRRLGFNCEVLITANGKEITDSRTTLYYINTHALTLCKSNDYNYKQSEM